MSEDKSQIFLKYLLPSILQIIAVGAGIIILINSDYRTMEEKKHELQNQVFSLNNDKLTKDKLTLENEIKELNSKKSGLCNSRGIIAIPLTWIYSGIVGKSSGAMYLFFRLSEVFRCWSYR